MVTEAGSYSRRIDSCTTQLKAQGPSRNFDASKDEEEDLVLILGVLPDATFRFGSGFLGA